MLTSGSEMIIGQEFVHIPARDGPDRSGLGGRNQGQRHVDTARHERLAARHMLRYDPPNQIARCAALSWGKHLELPEDLLRELDCSLHDNNCPTSGSPGNSRHRATVRPMSRCEAPESLLSPRCQVLSFSAVFSASSSAPPRLRVKTQPPSPDVPAPGFPIPLPVPTAPTPDAVARRSPDRAVVRQSRWPLECPTSPPLPRIPR